MNVIVSNKNNELLNNLNVEIIKKIDGEFTADEIINIFANFFYSKMFLDITALKNYSDIKELQKLAINLDASKIVLVLENNDLCQSPAFQSKLVNMGIYNFCSNLQQLNYLSVNTNVYRDVAHLQNVSLQENDVVDIKNKNSNSNSSAKSKAGFNPLGKLFNGNSYSSVMDSSKIFVLGFKNITSHAGSTSLIYMVKQQLSKFFSVVAIEVNRRDFVFFNDNDMISIRDSQLSETINRYSDRDFILLDLNDCNYEHECDDVLYLIEPSIIKLNKMIAINRNIFQKLNNKKIILNKSFLGDREINDFERESNSKIYFNIPPLNDRLENSEILLPLFDKLNFINSKDNKISGGKVKKLF